MVTTATLSGAGTAPSILFLKRNRVYFVAQVSPRHSDFVAVRRNDTIQAQRYRGQPNLGVILISRSMNLRPRFTQTSYYN
jgi:hypothetical protein